jgi:hypothetical protein
VSPDYRRIRARERGICGDTSQDLPRGLGGGDGDEVGRQSTSQLRSSSSRVDRSFHSLSLPTGLRRSPRADHKTRPTHRSRENRRSICWYSSGRSGSTPQGPLSAHTTSQPQRFPDRSGAQLPCGSRATAPLSLPSVMSTSRFDLQNPAGRSREVFPGYGRTRARA